MGRTRWTGLAVLVATMPAWAVPDAEYAVRWSPRHGGLADLEAVASALGIDGRTVSYGVRYFTIDRDPAIVRERTRDDHVDVTYKLRGDAGFPKGSLAAWRCPLRREDKRKDEVDVSIVDDASVHRSFSRSCTSKATLDGAVPKNLHPAPRGCGSEMRRRESADEVVTIEEWRIGGELLIEVSMKGVDADETERAFRERIVKKVAVAGFLPLDRSKTEWGTQPCSRR